MEKAITVEGHDFAENKSNNKKSMFTTLIEKARSLIRGEPEKSLVAKGITETNDTLTDSGEGLFIDYLYRKNKADFVADPAVAAILAEKDEAKS